ncbi:MAG: DUF1071 domain-containing protein [Helicobacteraceae bacterium]|nr:DUF1071 domain-containing protein [Helicobacteraceae bacterium]
METKKTVFETLSIIDVRNITSSKQGQNYISWSDCWDGIKKVYPKARYEVLENSEQLPYFESTMGIFVKVEVTIEDETQKMIMPVLDSINKAMKTEQYSYTTKKGERTVNACTSFDINTSIMRCVVKCCALFGYGLNVYRGQDFANMELIDSSQISEISNLIASKNLMLGELNAQFGINRLSELAAFNFDAALLWIEDAATS